MQEAAACRQREAIALRGIDSARYRALFGCVAAGFMIRLYLSLTNFCISGDGAAYIRMAQEYASGQWRKPLGAVFSPLYPLLIAGAHGLGVAWEPAGNLVSAVAGAAAIVTVYLLTREVFEREVIALGAAALTAIHPDLAAYSASVRTEAGYITLATGAVWLTLKALREGSGRAAVMAGAVGGLAYLYRTEAVVLLVILTFFPLSCALLWKKITISKAVKLGSYFALAALLFVGPYAVMLHSATGHWTVGREFTAAIMYGIGSASSHDSSRWRHLGFSANASPLMAVAAHPATYLRKVAHDTGMSLYGFLEAAGPLLVLLLAIGLWRRGGKILRDYREALPTIIIVCYFGAFTLTATGPRFMIHLIPFTFGWMIVGLERVTRTGQEFALRRGWRLSPIVPAIAVGLILLPQTLWPIGYDMRGVRYAGEAIAADNPENGAVIARDGRVAWYAKAPFIALPSAHDTDLCDWIAHQERSAYLLIGERDEQRFEISRGTSCLDFMKRYPRYGKGYYDLFAVRQNSLMRK